MPESSERRKSQEGRDKPGSAGTVERIRAMAFRRPWETAAYIALGAVALAMRLWDLGFRAMHHDESLHSFYAWNLSSGYGYEHNPMMHGPFQIEAAAVVFRFFGDSEFTARIPYVVAGTALVLLPLLLRPRLGRTGALIVSAMLAFSPTMLYFSRFARNDIIMAVWTLGLVGCMWRYIEEGKQRYLYVAAALLALAFTTKETAYIVTAVLGLYLTLTLVSEAWPKFRGTVVVGQVSPPVAIYRLVSGLVSAVASIPGLARESRRADFLALLVTLTLPLWAAMASVLQDTPLLGWSNLVLASPVGGGGPIGAPLRGGVALAAYIVVVLLLLGGLPWFPLALVGLVAGRHHLLRDVRRPVHHVLHQPQRVRPPGCGSPSATGWSSKVKPAEPSPGTTTSSSDRCTSSFRCCSASRPSSTTSGAGTLSATSWCSGP